MNTLKTLTSDVVTRLFSSDRELKKTLASLLPAAAYETLTKTLQRREEKMPAWDLLSQEAGRPEKLPRLEKYDRVGNLIEKIVLPLETQIFRREVVELGIFAKQSEVEKFAKIYLLAQLGESGVTCPLACTDGLIRVLSAIGSDFLKEIYLPLLTSTEYSLAGAQFITEQAGGSDVGAMEGRAIPQPEGHWHLTAEK